MNDPHASMREAERPPTGDAVARAIALALIEGFNNHYWIFRSTTRLAKTRFEQADWQGELRAVKERVEFYDARVSETTVRLLREFDAENLPDETWQQVKLFFIAQLINHKQPELAETFFNSVCCRILHRTYFHNDYIFARPAISTEFIQSYPPTWSSYYPQQAGLRQTLQKIIEDFGWSVPFENLRRDLNFILLAVARHLRGGWPTSMHVDLDPRKILPS